MTEVTVVATGLRFPEGPIALSDGSVLVVEIARGTVSRVLPDGVVGVVAETGGGPNGMALGPDRRCYVCNNGGFEWHERGGQPVPGLQGPEYRGGWIEAATSTPAKWRCSTGSRSRAPARPQRHRLRRARRLLVHRLRQDAARRHGPRVRALREGGRKRVPRGDPGPHHPERDRALAGRGHPLRGGNGPGRIWAWELPEPGVARLDRAAGTLCRGRLVAAPGGYVEFDSMAVDGAGNVCVATLHRGGITVAAPDGSAVEHVPLPDPVTTNVCFGGPDLRTAWATLSGTGQLVSFEWPRPGLRLNHT